MIDSPAAQGAAEQLSEWFSHHFERLDSLAQKFISTLPLADSKHLRVSDAARRRLKTVAVGFLAEDETIDGCGLIFAHSALGTENGQLEWWVREDESRFARYSFGVVPGADRYYDYEHHEWFIQSFHEGASALVGPYIDYLGVEAYVVTLAVPAESQDVRVGTVANDIQLKDLETALLPLLLQQPVEMVLLGRGGKVFFGNSSRFLPGDHVPDSIEGFNRAPLAPASTGLQLLYAVPSS